MSSSEWTRESAYSNGEHFLESDMYIRDDYRTFIAFFSIFISITLSMFLFTTVVNEWLFKNGEKRKRKAEIKTIKEKHGKALKLKKRKIMENKKMELEKKKKKELDEKMKREREEEREEAEEKSRLEDGDIPEPDGPVAPEGAVRRDENAEGASPASTASEAFSTSTTSTVVSTVMASQCGGG